MFQGYDKVSWNYLSHILAELHNTQFGTSKSDCVTAVERNPYADFDMLLAAKGISTNGDDGGG